MKLIRNARVYKATLPSASALEKHLAEKPFTEPMLLEAGSIGFVERDGYGWVSPFHGGLAFAIRIDEKIVPTSAINTELAKRVKGIEQTEGRKVGKKWRAEIKDGVIADLRCKALVKSAIITCYYDSKNNYLVVPTTSATIAGRIVSLLVQAVGSVKTETIHVSDVKQGLTTRMKAWLDGDEEAFDEFDPSGQVSIALNGQSITVKVASLQSAREGLQNAFTAGFEVKAIRLFDGELASFVMTSDFVFTSVEYPALAYDDHVEDAWAHEAAAQVLNFSTIITKLCAMFAYKEEQVAA